MSLYPERDAEQHRQAEQSQRGPEPWRNIPTAILDDQRRAAEAQAWADGWRKRLAAEWADMHIQHALDTLGPLVNGGADQGPYPGALPTPAEGTDPNANVRLASPTEELTKTGPADRGIDWGKTVGSSGTPVESIDLGKTEPAGGALPVGKLTTDQGPAGAVPAAPDVPGDLGRAAGEAPTPGVPGLPLVGPGLPFQPNKPVQISDETRRKILAGEPLTVEDFVGSFTKAAGRQFESVPGALEGVVPGLHVGTAEKDLARGFARGATETSGAGGGPGGAGGRLRAAGDIPGEVFGAGGYGDMPGKAAADAAAEVPAAGARIEAARPQLEKTVAASIEAAKQGGQRSGWLRAGYYFALLSNPLTHARNMIGNTVMGAAELATRPLAVAVDQVLSLAPGREKAMSWNEVPAELVGMAVGARVGLRRAAQAFGDPEVAAAAANKTELRQVLPPGQESASAAVRATGRAVSFPTQMLGVEDALYKGLYGQAVAWGEAARQVARLPEYAGKPITDRAVWAKIADLVENPTGAMAKNVDRRVNELVFQDAPDGFARAMNELRGKLGPAGWLAMPFTGTPYNIWKAAVRHTFGTDPSRWRTLKDPVEQAETLARLGIAGAIFAKAYTAAMDDRVTGTPPPGVDRPMWEATHRQTSVKAGEGTWVDYAVALPVYGPLITAAANIAQAQRYGRRPDEQAVHALGGALSAFLKNPFVPPVAADQVDSLLNGENVTLRSVAGSAQRALTRPLESLASPGVVRFGARVAEQVTGDTVDRAARPDLVGGAIDRTRENIPFGGRDLPGRVDVFGEPIRRQPLEVLSPIAISQRADDPVAKELTRLRTTRGESGDTIGKSLLPLSRTVRLNNRTLALDADAYDDAQARYGRELHRVLDELIAGPRYQDLADDVKAKTLARYVDLTRKRVETEILNEAGAQQTAPTRRRR